jgi:hypothetical protein
MIERRQHSRTAIQCHVSFESADAHETVMKQDIGQVINVSEKGLLLESSGPIYAATIRVIIPVRVQEPIQITGDVVYSIPKPPDHYHTGIVFHSSGQNSDKIVQYLLNAGLFDTSD